MKIRCERCVGLGRVSGLGGMTKECPACKGSKWMEVVEKTSATVSNKKKRGKK